MKRCVALAALSALLLAGCGSSTLTYELHFDVPEEAKQSDLTLALLRVINRRLARFGEQPADTDIQRKAGALSLSIEVSSKEVASALDAELRDPFTLEFMNETAEEGADKVVEGHGGFASTGVNATHIKWLTPQEEPGIPGKGRILLEFTDEGFTLMGKALEKNKGKYLGLFVRGQLAAKLLVDQEELKNIIVISELPSVEIANVFADDVNTGVHVTLAPLD